MVKNWRYWPIIRRFFAPNPLEGGKVFTFTVGKPNPDTADDSGHVIHFTDGTDPQIIRLEDSWYLEVWGGGGGGGKSDH
jgi:hypothetical protein